MLILKEVKVVARKKSYAEAIQDVPIAITAFSGDEIDATFVHDLQSLSFSMPNVSLEDIGTIEGTANFSIRGLGINSSIPSIDPTVGVFVDGMYLGINHGVVFDVFDLEDIEVLRGPQGLLFGRNVTGGAVLLKTRKPTDVFNANLKLSVEEGLDKIFAGAVSGPVIDHKLKVRLSAYYRDDDGWYTNLYDGNDNFGKNKTLLIRPSATFTPSDNVNLTVRYEHGKLDDQGPAAQNRGLFDRHTFDFSVDENGFLHADWDQVTTELNIDVPFGNGTITDIFGWRDFTSDSITDVDSSPAFLFHVPAKIFQDQRSNEIRYSGRFFDRLDLTTGIYWFEQDIKYLERRLIFGGLIDSTLGGRQDQTTAGVYAQGDISFTPTVTINLGLRYTYEKKDADIATFIPAGLVPLPSLCDFDAETCNYDYSDNNSWSNWTPKIGIQWKPNDDMQFYGFVTKGYRSGGYNFRNTSFVYKPEPFDEEDQTSFEIGAKLSWLDGRVRTNAAFFRNDVDNMQRELSLTDPIVGVVQLIRNTADAVIQGIEIEAQALVMGNLLVTGSLGYIDGEYDKVSFDISGDGVVNNADLALKIPRLAPLTYSMGFVHYHSLDNIGTLITRLTFNHRDSAAYTDNNVGTLNAADMLDVSMAVSTLEDRLSVSVYGKNLLDEVTAGNDTPLPASIGGGTFSPINNKGIRWGMELNYKYD